MALRWEGARGNAVECAANLWDVLLTATIAGVGIGRLTAMAAGGVNPLANIGDMLIVRGGVSTVGATVGALATVGLMARRELIQVFDALSVAALATLAGWHLGCLPRGACLGTPSGLPWAIDGGSGVGRHPVEIYASILLLLAAAGLTIYKTRRPLRGAPATLALIAAAGARAATEPLRPSLGGNIIAWYIGAAVIGIGTLVLLWRRANRQ